MKKTCGLIAVVLVTATLGVARSALAGPPLLCFPFEIGHARSLPMAAAGWHSTDPTYDVSRLVDDTVALLGADTPIVVRMETLRRATLYAGRNPRVAAALLKALEERARAARPDAGLAVFDFGYLVETYRQATSMFKGVLPVVDEIDGYALVRKAYAFRPDPQIKVAAELIEPSSRH